MFNFFKNLCFDFLKSNIFTTLCHVPDFLNCKRNFAKTKITRLWFKNYDTKFNCIGFPWYLLNDKEISENLIEIDTSNPEDFCKKLEILLDKQHISTIVENAYDYFNKVCDEEIFKKNYRKWRMGLFLHRTFELVTTCSN